jgi:hypothetical protein
MIRRIISSHQKPGSVRFICRASKKGTF